MRRDTLPKPEIYVEPDPAMGPGSMSNDSGYGSIHFKG